MSVTCVCAIPSIWKQWTIELHRTVICVKSALPSHTNPFAVMEPTSTSLSATVTRSKNQPQRPRTCRNLILRIALHALPIIPICKADVVFLAHKAVTILNSASARTLPTQLERTMIFQQRVGGLKGLYSIPSENGANPFLFLTISGLLYQRSGTKSAGLSKQDSTGCVLVLA